MAERDVPYVVRGNKNTQQAENSTTNPSAANTQMRILIELQVISMLLHEGFRAQDDLGKLRQDVADSIT